LDLRTPLEGARAAAAAWPRARVLAVPNTGHSVMTADLSGCVQRATMGFFRRRRVPARCRRGPNLFPATPPVPAALGVLRPLLRVAGDRGRVVRAVEFTLFDVVEDYLALLLTGQDARRGAGLRGGRWWWERSSTLRLHRLELVPGVRVSGTVAHFAERRQRARLRVSGPAGPDGRLVLRKTHVTGRLGGRRVDADIPIAVLEEARAASATRPG
jgi:hypothetical protein